MSGNYSETEIDTGYTWVDGRKIYKKTINFGALPNNTGKSVNHGISNLRFVIKVEAYAYSPSGSDFSMVPIVSTSGFPAALSISPTSARVTTISDRSSYSECYITIYYTKTS